ncbi:MAG: tRNA (adenosine(37)-N6)-threonylcarbamoyltransferase complex dimerization subunit type 1 TsaB [Rhodomicrobium sp.]
MIVLAIETSMGRTSVALATGRAGKPVIAKRIEAGQGQAEKLIPLIGALMDEAGVSFADLDRLAVSIGPGGFSGIRTGVAAARGIGLAASVPVAGATSFRIMARAYEQTSGAAEPYGIAAPAGLGAVYCQIFALGEKALTGIVALPRAECGAFFAGRAKVLTGPAAASLSEEGLVSLRIAALELFPDAAMLAEIAPCLDPERDLPVPHYVREADAKPQSGHVIALKAD